jgi:tRNA-specific 2-thiouridylase
MKTLTAIAISGGIDSLMAAHLLQEEGHDVLGFHFITGYETDFASINHVENAALTPKGSSENLKNRATQRIAVIADQLGIPFKILDLSAQFSERVVQYFTTAYAAGLTPNPCMICNPLIKFGSLFDSARRLGATRLATGHYARIERDDSGRSHLLKGIDAAKDQSYFLAFLKQDQLARAVFPLGNFTKSDTKRMAAAKGLHPVTTGESQDICFIKGQTYAEFLARHAELKSKPGPIEDINGTVIGEHKGLHLFTIGQRRGINCPAAEPYYVIRIDTAQNRLIVGFNKDLGVSECRVKDINWINGTPASPIQVKTRVRYRHQAAPATVHPTGETSALVRFETPEAAITPGQGAVFYRNDEVLGGGWIIQ